MGGTRGEVTVPNREHLYCKTSVIGQLRYRKARKYEIQNEI